MKSKIIEKDLPPRRRILVAGDIHAHLTLFESLLRQADFSDEDELVLLGDLISDGPENLACLRMAMRKRKNVTVLKGNWESGVSHIMMSDDPARQFEMKARMLRSLRECGGSLLSDMAREVGETLTEDTDMARLMPKVRARFENEIRFMRELPCVLEAGGYFFVHGGTPTMDHNAIEKMSDYGLTKNDAFAEQGYSFSRWMVVGHWPVSLYDREGIPHLSPHVYRDRKIISIDGGCGKFRAGQLNLLTLHAHSGESGSYIAGDDLPTVRALDAQAEKMPTEILCWQWNRDIEILRTWDDMAEVRSRTSGRTIEVPASFLHHWHGTLTCSDISDAEPAVRPGDELRVIAKCSRGLYVKKDSRLGWYRGRYRDRRPPNML